MSDNASQPAAHPSLKPGDMLSGKYKVETILAKGGFSFVYTCKWVERATTVVAKVLHHEGVTKDHAAYARFVRESRIAKAVDHPHHVRVYDYGKTEEGLPFLILELLHGETLLDVFEKKGRMDPRKLAMILGQMADALGELHDKGIVHRDLKMPNVYLCDTLDGSTHIKVIDYGLAKIITPDNPDVKNLTTKDIVVGTPGYLAPEALVGAPATPLFDIYAMGVIGYEMLTGTRAYTGSLMEKALAQSAGNPSPPPPKLRGIQLWPVIEKMLARNPMDRYQSVHDVEEALSNLGDPGAIRKQPPPTPAAASSPGTPKAVVETPSQSALDRVAGSHVKPGPNPMIIIAVAVVVLVLIIVVLVST